MVDAAAAEGEDTHQLGVVGIFFDVVENATNPAFDAMFGHHDEHLDNIRWPHKSEHTEIVKGLDLAELIPEDIGTAGYYAYEGSLTTPPCTNIVRWHVMNAPSYRVVQENENTVYACMEGETVETDDKAEEDDSSMRGIVIAYAILVPVMSPILLGVICCYKNKRANLKN